MSMAGYTKLFSSILASTIWRAPDKTRIVWITMLAMADKDGIVDGSVPGLADMARVNLKDCAQAIQELSDPDEYSRTTDFEGRRIQKVDGGWQILNHAKYRHKMSADERREYNRQKQAEWRERKKMSNGVIDDTQQSAMSAQEEADSEAKAKARKKPKSSARQTDEELIQSLSEDPTYEGIDVRREHGKMMRWCQENHQTPSRKRFINWLNRAEKPMGARKADEPKRELFIA